MSKLKQFWTTLRDIFSLDPSNDPFHNCPKDFQLWAFGEVYSTLTTSGKIDQWNNRHGYVLKISPCDNLKKRLEQMANIYESECIANKCNEVQK